MQIVTKLANHN